MSQYNVNSLADLKTSNYSSEIAANKPQSAGPFQAMIRDVNDAIGRANDATTALATRQAGSSLPTWNRQGELAYNTTSSLLFLDPDAAGFDDQVDTELTAYQADHANAGTDTFKMGGPLNVDSSNVNVTAAGGILESYTVPASTLSSNGNYMCVMMAGTASNGAATPFLNLRLGTASLGSTALESGATDWMMKAYVVRTGASAQKSAIELIENTDDSGTSSLVGIGAGTKDVSTNLALDVNVSAQTNQNITKTMSSFVFYA